MICALGSYSEIFGKPREGTHSLRLFDVAIIDVISTIILGFFLSFFMEWNLWIVILFLFILAEILHLIFCVRTKFIEILELGFGPIY